MNLGTRFFLHQFYSIRYIFASFLFSRGIDSNVAVNHRKILVREAEVILPAFSRGKSILLLNCPLDVQ